MTVIHFNTEEEFVIHNIAEAARDLGYPCYVVGGFVRDKLLGRANKDIDVSCIGSGIKLAKHAAGNFKPSPKVAYFKKFGTAMFKVGDIEVEFVGARKESYRETSRKPIVEDGSLDDDLNRRDFTINALAVNLDTGHYEELIDKFGGVKDLADGIIRTPLDPDITFSDDPLRMMRAIRFATQLNFTIEQETYEAIKRNAHRISIVSIERITDELNKIIAADVPSIGFKLLFHTGLLELFFPEMAKLQGVDRVGRYAHKDNFFHTLQVLDNTAKASDDLWLRWGAILHDIAKPPTKRFEEGHGWTFHGHEVVGARMVPTIFRKLKLPMDHKMKKVQNLVALHLRPIALVKEIVTDSAVRRLLFEAGDHIDELMILAEADVTTKNDRKLNQYLKNFTLVRQKLQEVEEKDRVRNFQPPVSGEVIMKTFNIKPSREVGDLKAAIKEAILDGEIRNDYDEAFAFMLKLGNEMGLKVSK